jgi:hypothetical protein
MIAQLIKARITIFELNQKNAEKNEAKWTSPNFSELKTHFRQLFGTILSTLIFELVLYQYSPLFLWDYK